MIYKLLGFIRDSPLGFRTFVYYICSRNPLTPPHPKMKFTKLSPERDTIRRAELNVSAFLAQTCGNRSRRMVERLREQPSARTADKLPVIITGGSWHSGRLIRYSGMILLNFGPLADEQEAERVKQRAAELPHTYLALTGSSGRSVKVLVRCTRPDGSLPVLEPDIQAFHTEAHALIALHYCPNVAVAPARKTASPLAAFRLTYDPAPYYNPEARVLTLPPVAAGTTSFLRKARRAGILPSPPKQKKTAEPTVPTAKSAPATPKRKTDIPKTDKQPEGRIQQTLSTLLDTFMQQHYEVRRNLLKNETEIRRREDHPKDFHPVTSARFNQIVIEAMEAGTPVWDKDVKRYLQSDRIPVHHPLQHYLNGLPPWDGRDRIDELARRIPQRHPLWIRGFRCWLVGLVAQWMNRDSLYGNCLTPLLVGNQGDGKSTFCRRLLPPALADYYTDRIDLNNRREAELALHRFALVNLDEFDQSGPAQQAFLKHLLQKAEVTARRPYETAMIRTQRHASFIATTNAAQPLCDMTGSRRFLCVELTGRIDNTLPIDHDQLYAQALHLLRTDACNWLGPEEERQLAELNRSFLQCDLEEDFLNATFRRPASGDIAADPTTEELTCTEIALRIKARHPQMPYDRGTIGRIARLLIRDGYPRRRTSSTLRYLVVPA